MLSLQQHSVQEHEVQPLCPPDAISWHADSSRQQDEQVEGAFESEQLIIENEENSSAREPFMHAKKSVSRT